MIQPQAILMPFPKNIRRQKFLRRLKAFARQTFVTDCPVCHKHFYGIDAYKGYTKIGSRYYRIICHRCALKHK